MSDHPSNNPVVQGLQLLLSGGGFNFYSRDTLMRADDLLVRQQASGSLAQAAASVKALESEYAHRFVSPSTRDHPFPPPEALEKMRELKRLRERISGLESGIRGMPVPTQDKVWWRFRQETRLLNDLLLFDHGMLLNTAEVARLAHSLTPDTWQTGEAAALLAATLLELEALVQNRQHLLVLP